MEEIKFRAWDEERKQMYSEKTLDIVIHLDGSVNLISPNGYIEGKSKAPKLQLLLYTGFQDCYGRDIFEGDIIEYGNSTHDRGVVTIDGGTWRIRDFDRLISLGYPKICAYIIGNMYESPHSLGGSE